MQTDKENPRIPNGSGEGLVDSDKSKLSLPPLDNQEQRAQRRFEEYGKAVAAYQANSCPQNEKRMRKAQKVFDLAFSLIGRAAKCQQVGKAADSALATLTVEGI